MTGIGGDGFWLIVEADGRVHGIHGCGGAAAAADLSLYAGMATVPTRGPLAANTVAGTISAWEAALAGGTLPLDRLLRDAIDHAERGVAVTAGGAAIAAAKGAELRGQPGAYAAIFEPDGRPLVAGDVVDISPSMFSTTAAMQAKGDFGGIRYYSNEWTYVVGQGLRPWYGVQPRLMNAPLPLDTLSGGIGSVSYNYSDNGSFMFQQPHNHTGMQNMQRFVEGRRL
ncbi:hypothetical protein LTR94_030455, partial [Friedmanniomyces endolithicus]